MALATLWTAPFLKVFWPCFVAELAAVDEVAEQQKATKGPYDVIERVHCRDCMPHTVKGAAKPEPAPAGSTGKRATASEGNLKGSGNPTPRSKQRADANAAARAERGSASRRGVL